MIIVAIVFVVMGILIKYAKLYSLIAGYKTMSDEEKEKVDIKGIAELMKNVLFAMAVIVLAGIYFAKKAGEPNLEIMFLITSLVIGVPYLIIKLNSSRYKKK
ncbi:MAG: undecaprenyl pyrophosphate phosphatase UppP [Lentimonas sp.]|jgi:undecaprenyl pyrophosphate phosphatase UppP